MESRDGIVRKFRANDDEDTVTFPLSSEQPFRRWDGDEILVHTPGAVDLSFLNSGNAPLLDSHNRWDGLKAQIGVITKAWLEKKRVYVTVKFSSRADAQAIKQDVMDGIVNNVSVGYDIHKTERDEDADEYRVTKWTPKEASFVAIPADETVGMGRSANHKEGHMAPTNQNQPSAGTDVRSMPAVVVVRTEDERAVEIETALNEIRAIAQTHNQGRTAEAFIHGAMTRGDVPSLAIFKGVLRSELPEDTALVNEDIGMSAGEQRNFSLMRLARAMAEGATSADQEAARFEIDACNAAADQSEQSLRGKYKLPMDLMRSWGDFEIDGYRSTDPRVRAAMGAAGNPNVQDTEHLSSRFIDNLRNASSILRAGVTVLGGLDGNIELPGGDANAAAAWLASEDADVAETVPTFRKVSMNIKDLGAFTDLTRRMLMQSTIDIENYVRSQLVQAMVQAIDTAGLYGSGAAGVPTGIDNTSGIGAVIFAAAIPTRGEIIDLRTAIATANVGRGITYMGNSAMVGDLQQTKVDAGSGVFLMGDSADRLVGNSYLESNQITDGDLFAGDFSAVLMGMWGSLELDRSTEAKFLSGGLRLRAIQSVDFGVTRVGALAVGNDNI